MRRLALSLTAAVTLATPALAAEQPALVGTWRLLSYDVVAKATGQTHKVMGEHPGGYAAFLPTGRVFFVLTGEGRTPGPADADKAKLLTTLVAYTGAYTLKGDQWTTHVEAAWDPAWVGTDQTRTFKVVGDRLQVLTPWRLMPNWAAEGETRSVITFERASL